jgi:lipopolysaccharide transport system ATP-binding protein
VLSVGDQEFRARCTASIRDLREAGAALLFVSHDLEAVEMLADRAVLLADGRVKSEGSPAEVIGPYRAAAGTGAL